MMQEHEKLNTDWNLHLNKDKSQLLIKDTATSVAGVPSKKQVRYLGFPVNVDLKQ